MIGRHRAWKESELFDIRVSFLEGEKQIDLATRYDTTQKTISKIVNLQVYNDCGIPDDYINRYYHRAGRPLHK